MSFDIAIGRCVELGERFAVARLDGALLRKLRPAYAFVGQPGARLRVPLSVCSTRRPPVMDQELFLDYAKVAGGAEASLILLGQDDYTDTDIRLIASGMEPLPRPAPEPKQRFSDWTGRR
ncbi:hypothetical protein [Tahibacter caeni]|uniref:hypothetical protein n=1 Tax=Tahibacter caeni TaxID=1453545 RepID=UPI002148CC5D|nr:hypothetical protein [Tahibacter caeni]